MYSNLFLNHFACVIISLIALMLFMQLVHVLYFLVAELLCTMLEGKITESGFFGSKMCAGDVAITSVINFGLDNDLDLAPFPKLQAMYAAICLGEGPCAAYIASAPGPYFKRPVPP